VIVAAMRDAKVKAAIIDFMTSSMSRTIVRGFPANSGRPAASAFPVVEK
jgi:hypothetical protein